MHLYVNVKYQNNWYKMVPYYCIYLYSNKLTKEIEHWYLVANMSIKVESYYCCHSTSVALFKKKDFWSGTENGFVYDNSKYIADHEEDWNSMWRNINGSTFSPQQKRGLNNRIELLTTITSLYLIGRICNLIDPAIIGIVINFRLYLFIVL